MAWGLSSSVVSAMTFPNTLVVIHAVVLWQGMVAAWEAVKGPLDQYGMQHTRAFANLCNSGVTPCAFKASVINTLKGAATSEQPRAIIFKDDVIRNNPEMVVRAPAEKGGRPIMSSQHPSPLERLSKSMDKVIKSAVRPPRPYAPEIFPSSLGCSLPILW